MRSADESVEQPAAQRGAASASPEGISAEAVSPEDPAPEARGAAAFRAALANFESGRERQGRLRREFTFEDVAAPRRLAPYASAIAATVTREGTDVAWGRLVLLYDPDGQASWAGAYRMIAYVRADVDPEIAADPLLGQVGWSWLTEALEAHVPGYAASSGTVTRVITEGFGAKEDEEPLTGFELRASWSPDRDGDAALAAHVAAWCDCLCAAAGLPPQAPGTRVLPQGRRR